jgi:hypothetical protein
MYAGPCVLFPLHQMTACSARGHNITSASADTHPFVLLGQNHTTDIPLRHKQTLMIVPAEHKNWFYNSTAMMKLLFAPVGCLHADQTATSRLLSELNAR